MTEERRILAINGSYRKGGMTDQAVEKLLEHLHAMGAATEHIKLREHPIGFCRNCRQCMQQPGDAPGVCALNDGMVDLIRKIENADAYVFAAPTNFSSATALFKRFSERLAVYGYWPWGKPAPVFRRAKMPKKPVVIVSSCAAPSLLGRLTYVTNKNLRIAAKTIGGKVVGSMVTGWAAKKPEQALPRRAKRRARALAPKLAA